MREKLERPSELISITPEGIRKALDGVEAPAPRHARPEVIVTVSDQMLERAALEAGIDGSLTSVASLMEIHPLAWAKKWVDWLDFMSQAAKHEGIVISAYVAA